MAEEPTNTSQPISEYSNLETNLSTPENIQPFSGDIDLSVPNINFPTSNASSMPGPNIMKNIVGLVDDLPGTSGIGDTKNGMAEFISAQQNEVSNASNERSYAKMFTYDAGPDGSNFYDRYAAYGDDKFEEIGFHPYRDNEANFNANTTWWDDTSRMMQHSFGTLFSRGFVDGPKSLGKMLMGDFRGADLQDAAEYERAAAIGQSSKEGIAAFMNNTAMNFGYTAGIITEAIAEEIALSAMTMGSGGATAGIQGARTAQLFKNIGTGLGKFGKGAEAVKGLLTKVNSPTTARAFWDTTVGKGIKVLNPLENTFSTINTIKKSGSAGKDLISLANLSKTAGGFYRDVRNVNMAISESRLEAGMVENKIFKKLYDDHYTKFEQMPTADEQHAMRMNAKKGSLETFQANAGIIYATNKITFRNITSPKGGLRNFLKESRKDIYTVGTKAGEKQFGTLGKVIFDNSKKAFAFEKNSLKNLAKSWWKQPGFGTAKKTLGYFKANVSEGIQENLQETIARTNEKHYIEAYKQQLPSAAVYAKGVNKRAFRVQMGLIDRPGFDKYKEELGKEFSAQGFETFMSGFMMGTFAKPFNSAIPFLYTQGARIYNKAEYAKWKEDKLTVTKSIVDNLNELNVDELINSRLMNLGTQDKVSKIYKDGSKKEALDAEVDSFVSSLALMRKTGTTQVFIEKLKDLQQLTDAELVDAVDSVDITNASNYRNKLEKAVTKFESIDKNFEKVEKLFPNPANISDLSAEELATPEGQSLVRLHNAWNKSTENFVYLNESFVDTTKRMDSIFTDYLKNTSLATADYASAKVLFKPQSISSQIGILNSELAIEESKENISKSEKSKNIKFKKEQIKTLKEFQNAQALFYGFYQRNETPTLSLAKRRLAEEDNIEDPTPEQIDSKLDELLGDITDEKQQVTVTKNLQKAHDAYLRSLAEENNSTIFQTNLDNAFNQLTDFYKLNFESRVIAEHIDLLTDPGEFLKLVLENEKVNERLASQLNELNSDVVDEQVNKVALAQLLNALANNAPPLYLSQEQATDLYKNKIVPKFFTGHKNQTYDINSEPYQQGIELINKNLELSSILTSNIDPVSGVEMTEAMKKSVEEVKTVFKNSKDIKKNEKQTHYMKDGVIYSRVSNVMSKLFDDYGYNQINKIQNIKERVFKKEGDFLFNEENIDKFINEIKLDVDAGVFGKNSGINKVTYTNLRKELVGLSDVTEDVLTTSINEIIPRITYESGRVRGNTLDDMVRDFFDPQTDLKYDDYKDRISQNAYIGLFGESGHLTKLKEKVNSGDIYIFSKDLQLADSNLKNKDGEKIANVAGALDLIIIDKTGKKYIADLKTGVNTKWATYLTKGESSYNYKKFFQNSMQQRAYSNLYYNNSGGENIETLILPLSVEADDDGFIVEFNEIPKRDFQNQKPIVNIIDDNMFMKTDNTATIKVKGKSLKVTAIDKLIPRSSTKGVEGELDINEVIDTTGKEQDLIDSIAAEKRKSIVDDTVITELEEELNEVRNVKSSLKASIKSPENDEDKIFEEFLNARRTAARKNTIEEGKQLVTEYINNDNKIIKIEKKIVSTSPSITDAQAKAKTINNVNFRIDQLYNYDKLNYERKDLIEDTIDNITGKVFAAEIGNKYDPEINAYGEEKAQQTILVDSVYLTDDGNYAILAQNLRTDKTYDMIVEPDGSIVSFNNTGSIANKDTANVVLDDSITFDNDSFARKRTDADVKQTTEVSEPVNQSESLPATAEIDTIIDKINDNDNIDTKPIYQDLNDQYNDEQISQEEYAELEELLDQKASAILESEAPIDSNKVYTFKEPLDSRYNTGDQIRIKFIDGENKTIGVTKIEKTTSSKEEVPLTPNEFQTKIDFGTEEGPKEGEAEVQIKETNDVLKNFLEDTKRQKELDESKVDYFDTSKDSDIFQNCE
tara:strand:- start:16087 stop:21840 length:5754 start_codon:yes stop_codon:yes gene_type:complete